MNVRSLIQKGVELLAIRDSLKDKTDFLEQSARKVLIVSL